MLWPLLLWLLLMLYLLLLFFMLAVDWVDVMPITHCNNDFTIRMYCSGLISRIHLFHPKNLLLFVATSWGIEFLWLGKIFHSEWISLLSHFVVVAVVADVDVGVVGGVVAAAAVAPDVSVASLRFSSATSWSDQVNRTGLSRTGLDVSRPPWYFFWLMKQVNQSEGTKAVLL